MKHIQHEVVSSIAVCVAKVKAKSVLVSHISYTYSFVNMYCLFSVAQWISLQT